MNPDAKKTLRKLLIAVPLMFAFGFALVPLYDVFCEVTGINGKVFQSDYEDELLTDNGRPLAIQFISTNNLSRWTHEITSTSEFGIQSQRMMSTDDFNN